MVKGVFLTNEEYEELQGELDRYKSFYNSAIKSIKNNNKELKCGHNWIEVDVNFINSVLGYDISKEENSIYFKAIK